jgi:hypothetical protein
MNIYTPYVYLIGWSNLDTYYIGARWANGCHPSDLWDTYFTSSTHVNAFREMYGDPDIIKIRKTFRTKKEAREYEEKLLIKIDAASHPKFLNRRNQITVDGFWNHTDETRRKISESMKKRCADPEYRKKLSELRKNESMKKRCADPEYRKKISDGLRRAHKQKTVHYGNRTWTSSN